VGGEYPEYRSRGRKVEGRVWKVVIGREGKERLADGISRPPAPSPSRK
jgi:hypothetical protein